VHRARQRLDEGRLLVVHVVPDQVGVTERHRDILSEGTVDGVPDRPQLTDGRRLTITAGTSPPPMGRAVAVPASPYP
jgi:hypothetical protein